MSCKFYFLIFDNTILLDFLNRTVVHEATFQIRMRIMDYAVAMPNYIQQAPTLFVKNVAMLLHHVQQKYNKM